MKKKFGQWGSKSISDMELSLLINQLRPHALERDYKVELKKFRKTIK